MASNEWKLLCLHGQGTSAGVLEYQIKPFVQVLDNQFDGNFEIVYLEGKVPCGAPPFAGTKVPGPHMCYYKNYVPSEVKLAHEQIDEIIKREGPFEGVLGFSQGASLALSWLMHFRLNNPIADCPIRFAILFAPFMAVACDSKVYSDILKGFSSADVAVFEKFLRKDPSQPSEAEIEATSKFRVMQLAADALRIGLEFGVLEEDFVVDLLTKSDPKDLPRIFDGRLMEDRVGIPVVHIVGNKDPLKPYADQVQGLCHEDHMKVLKHDGAHVIPTNKDFLKKVAEQMQWAMGHSKYAHW